MKKRLTPIVMILIASVAIVIAGLTWKAYAATPGTTKTTTEIIAKDVTQVRVFVSRDNHAWEMTEKTGKIYDTGTGHDVFMTIDPVISGERIYPRDLKDLKPGAFFYLDQLQEVKGIVFKVKSGAKVYSVKAEHSEVPGFHQPKEDQKWDSDKFIVIQPKDLLKQRVYVSGFYTGSDDKTRKQFLWRQDLELVSYRP